MFSENKEKNCSKLLNCTRVLFMINVLQMLLCHTNIKNEKYMTY